MIAIFVLGLITVARTLGRAVGDQATNLGAAVVAIEAPVSGSGDGSADRPEPGGADQPAGAADGGEGSGQNGGDSEPEQPKCDGFFACVWEKATSSPLGGLDLWWDYVFEIGRGAVDDVTGIWDLVTDPGSILDAAKYAWDNPLDAARQLVWDDESKAMWEQGNYTGGIGRAVWNVGSWFIPGVNAGRAASVLGKLGRLGRLGKIDLPKAPDVKKPDANAPDAANGRRSRDGDGSDPERSNAPDDSCPPSGCPNGDTCFAAGTLVHTETGLRPIEDVSVGERVWSRDEHSGAVALQPVLLRFVTPEQPLLRLRLRAAADATETALKVTAPHPFWTRRGWVPARDLAPGDEVLLRSGAWSGVRACESTGEVESVYNFAVAAFHTYFVGNEGIWVHNDYHPPPSSLPAFPDAKHARPKTPVQGGGGLRKRWKNNKGEIYEWDSQHGTVERYNKRGKHLGEFDPNTGAQLKPADPTRTVEP